MTSHKKKNGGAGWERERAKATQAGDAVAASGAAPTRANAGQRAGETVAADKADAAQANTAAKARVAAMVVGACSSC